MTLKNCKQMFNALPGASGDITEDITVQLLFSVVPQDQFFKHSTGRGNVYDTIGELVKI
ncbi:Hypothetical protein CINCED_3A010917 [Cinara cedri]|uniref:Uncharacterized protein n=1 Tax=Cinara cedri TaxID=506608 RepID=A0A5E4N266_9HEMI|nr:Hypothetical protein CINCED_3A010917 [Cinara cedri]